MSIGIYPGSFDPPTMGHVNIIQRSLAVVDELVVAVANNTSKRTVFTPDERVEMLQEIFARQDRVKVTTFQGLLVNYLTEKDMQVVIRGVRTMQDFENEFQMAQANKQMQPTCETLFLVTDPRYSHISSTLLKEIITLGGNTAGMLPDIVEERLRKRLTENS